MADLKFDVVALLLGLEEIESCANIQNNSQEFQNDFIL
jgi:hypothetical protein